MPRFRSMLQAVIPSLQYRPKARTTTTIQKMPPEIVDLIFAFLSIPDQICFSLSCKYLFACLQSSIEQSSIKREAVLGMQMPHLLPPETRPVLSRHAKKRPIVQLLHRLENTRWKFCSECWTLHPRPTTSTSRNRLIEYIGRLRGPPSYCSECLAHRQQFYYLPYRWRGGYLPLSLDHISR